MLRRLFGGGGPDIAEIARRVDAGEILLVDVREQSEWRSGHAKRAKHIPLARLPKELDRLAKDGRPVAFICRSGGRSRSACSSAQSRGIEAINVGGGMMAWQRAGLPVVR